MRKFSRYEEKIIRELIRNPRISDNQIAKNTKIPTTTVNRKRRQLEEDGLIHYYTNVAAQSLDKGHHRTRQLYIIKFKEGLTRKEYVDAILKSKDFRKYNAVYHAESYLGEKDGHFAMILVLEAEGDDELVEIFNGEIIPKIRQRYGNDCINDIITTKITFPFRLHHNYLPIINMDKGKIKDSWLDDWIFVPNT